MTTVWQHSKAEGSDLLVLLALADIADDNGECWPSVGYIARKCRIDTRTVQRRIRSLEQLDEVVVIKGGGKTKIAGATPSNRYRITIHLPEEGEGGDLPGGGDLPVSVTGARGRVATLPGRRVAPVPPNTSIDTSVDTSKTCVAFDDDFSEVWEVYPKKVDRGKAARAYGARRKSGATREDLLGATHNYVAWIQTTGTFVKNAATFFGPDSPFADFVSGIPEGAIARPAAQSKSMSAIDAAAAHFDHHRRTELKR